MPAEEHLREVSTETYCERVDGNAARLVLDVCDAKFEESSEKQGTIGVVEVHTRTDAWPRVASHTLACLHATVDGCDCCARASDGDS